MIDANGLFQLLELYIEPIPKEILWNLVVFPVKPSYP